MSFSHNATVDQCAEEVTLEARLTCLADAGPQAISDRLAQIEREWSVGRLTKAAIGVLITVGVALTALVSPWWLLLPALGGLLLLQYLFDRAGWLGEVFRAMGFRRGAEIDQEKFALKTLRGDFKSLPSVLEIVKQDDLSRLEGEGGITHDPEETKPDAKDVVKQVVRATKC